jgi:putative transposase
VQHQYPGHSRNQGVAHGELSYHVLNRANGRQRLFDDDGDYCAFERVMTQACDLVSMRLLAYCVMPNHWHLVVWPRHDSDLSRFMNRLPLTQPLRWYQHRQTVGTGPLYQGRFKSFVTQTDEHLLTVCRYVERNALRAGLVERAEAWRWSSLWRKTYGDATQQTLVSEWPVARPPDWVGWVNADEGGEELRRLGQSVVRSQPFGELEWVTAMIERFGLVSTIRNERRPRKIRVKNCS